MALTFLSLLSSLLVAAISLTANPHNYAFAREMPTKTWNLDSPAGGCWTALWEIKSCMNEIEAYFVNGTIDIGPPCCQAIATITHHCWPVALYSVGITPEESDILRGYCDAESAARVVSFPPVSSPVNSLSDLSIYT